MKKKEEKKLRISLFFHQNKVKQYKYIKKYEVLLEQQFISAHSKL